MKGNPAVGEPAALAEYATKNLLPRALPGLQEMSSRLGLDYFGIDCHLGENGEITVFEANANMNIILDRMPVFSHLVAPIEAALKGLIERRSGEKLAAQALN